MNKLTRYNLAEIARTYSSDKHSVVCTAYDVAKLEAINAELLEALRLLLAECEHQAWIGNMPDDRVEFGIARAAIAKANGEGV